MPDPSLICGPGDTAAVVALYALDLQTDDIIRLQRHAAGCHRTLREYTLHVLRDQPPASLHCDRSDPARPLWQE